MGLYRHDFGHAGVIAAPVRKVPEARRARGRMAQLAGVLAEDAVLARYLDEGCELLARRWRGMAGEIDLILRQGECTVFVEVKQSVSHAAAAERLGRSQMKRICLAACEYCDNHLAEMRFDVALVDGLGRIEILENAFGEW